jgi:hypothetical protein
MVRLYKSKMKTKMKKLELQSFGVVELNNDEMRKTDGGGCPGIEWLMGYNDIMAIEDTYERESALSAWMSVWANP